MTFLRREDGVTLIELLIVMPMMLLVLGGVVTLSVRTSGWAGQKQEETAQQGDVRAVVSTLVSDLRQAYLGNGFPIKSISPTAIDFYSPDRQSPFRLREIAYRLSGPAACQTTPLAAGVACSLQRLLVTSLGAFTDPVSWTWPATPPPFVDQLHTLVRNAPTTTPPTTTPLFTYYDASGALYAGADPTVVRRVVITLTASTGGSQPDVFTYTDSALLRETLSS
jgi:type II secretory pathway pseudopilin PulG